MAISGAITLRHTASEALSAAVAAGLRPLHALMAAPSLLFLGALTVMLFRPPDIQFYAADRVVFLLLALAVMLRVWVSRRPVVFWHAVTLPMLGLAALSAGGALLQPFDAQTWSLLAAKFVVPYALFHLSALVFDNERSLRQFETFALWVLAYLSLIAMAFLVGATGLIFPRYILDEGLGIHADRARGPFLQAVANGVTLNMLGLLALDAFRRRRLRGLSAGVLLTVLPMAVLATLTRAVWISFAGSAVVVFFRTSSLRLKRASRRLVIAGIVGLVAVLAFAAMRTTLQDRAEERGPVEIRLAVYQAGWQMFMERPFSGWGVNQMPPELAHRMGDYHLQAFWPHNTYLEILVEHGVAGLGLYVWVIVGLFRLAQKPAGSSDGSFLDDEFRKMWPVLVSVYLFNATFVVMNYQFVNGLLFTLAGMLAAQNRSMRRRRCDGYAS